MSVNFNQTNINADTAFASGGSNFPGGIQIGNTGGGSELVILQSGSIPAIGGAALGYVSDSNGANLGWLANPVWSGDTATSYLKLTSNSIGLTDGNGSNEQRFVTGATGFALANVSSMVSGSNNANMVALMSSLKGTFPTCFS